MIRVGVMASTGSEVKASHCPVPWRTGTGPSVWRCGTGWLIGLTELMLSWLVGSLEVLLIPGFMAKLNP